MVTIIIPTYASRNVFLKRLLIYLRNNLCEYPILIADSSEKFNKKLNKTFINSIAKTLDVQYYSFDTQIDIVEKLKTVISKVRTPYTVFNADDDYIVPSSIKKCANFLEINLEFSIAHGNATAFQLNNDNILNKFETYRQNTIIHDSPAHRLIAHLNSYTLTFYSVHRTVHIKKNIESISKIGSLDFRFKELLPSCLSVIQGKIKKLDCLYMIREGHDCSNTKNFNRRYTMPNWIADPEWSNNYYKFRYMLAKALVQQQNISLDSAKNVVKNALFSYIFYSSLGNRYVDDIKTEQKLALDNLLKPDSHYYNDFLPIYTSITSVSHPHFLETDEFLTEIDDLLMILEKVKHEKETCTFLKKSRLELANRILNTSNTAACKDYLGYLGKVHKVFSNSGLKKLPLFDFEKPFIKKLAHNLKNDFESKPVQYSLVAALYY